jgi:hypothetical protein
LNDWVWCDRSDTALKLQPRWSGPHPVLSRVGTKYHIGMADGAAKAVHVDRLRPADVQKVGLDATPLYFARPAYSRKETDTEHVMPVQEITQYRHKNGHQEWYCRREGSREFVWERVHAFVETPLPAWQSFNRAQSIEVDFTTLPRTWAEGRLAEGQRAAGRAGVMLDPNWELTVFN